MSLIRRNVTRTILNSTEATKETDTPAASALSFVLTNSDKFYVGFKKPFAARYFHLSVLNTNSITVSMKYWNGTEFSSVDDLVDQTLGFTTNGFISWTNATDWKKVVQAGVSEELYWVEISVSGALSAGTALQAVLNIFCDDSLLRAHYPELISDTRWLPSGRTDFLEQYVAAKDQVVKRLKGDGIITDESQIIDPNEVANAAAHAAAFIIMFPVSRSDEDRQAAADAEKEMNKALNQVKLDIDINDDGVIQDAEQETGNVFKARG